MTRKLEPALILFALGMIGLGTLALVYADFALVWQPVPPGLPGRTGLAYASGLLMLGVGIGLLFRPLAALSVRVLLPYLLLWTLLKLPALLVAPQMEAVWLGIGEIGALLAGGWVLFAKLSGLRTDGPLSFAVGEKGVRGAVMLFGVCLLPIGLSHLVYPDQTAAFVPAWLPMRLGWAYLTGAGQMAAGFGILLRVFPRPAAIAEASMLSLFALLVWLPAVAAAPTKRLPWTAFFITWAIAAAAWVVAGSMPAKESRIPD